jgi:hypothetical protein
MTQEDQPMVGIRKLAPLTLALAALMATIGGPTLANQPTGLQVQHNGGGAPGAATNVQMADPQVAQLQAQVSKLASQMSALQAQVASLQGSLSALHTQFNNHVHTYPTMPNAGILTILKCAGYGQPCTSATPMSEITVLVPATTNGLANTSPPTTPPGGL